MPPGSDLLDADLRNILRATLAVCTERNYRVQCCASLTGMPENYWGSTFFGTSTSEKEMTERKPFNLQDRMAFWIDFFIESGAVDPEKVVCVHVFKELVMPYLPGITLFMWSITE